MLTRCSFLTTECGFRYVSETSTIISLGLDGQTAFVNGAGQGSITGDKSDYGTQDSGGLQRISLGSVDTKTPKCSRSIHILYNESMYISINSMSSVNIIQTDDVPLYHPSDENNQGNWVGSQNDTTQKTSILQ